MRQTAAVQIRPQNSRRNHQPGCTGQAHAPLCRHALVCNPLLHTLVRHSAAIVLGTKPSRCNRTTGQNNGPLNNWEGLHAHGT